MRIRQFYSPRVFRAEAEEDLVKAAARMDVHQVGVLAVFDAENLIGMISERDVTRAVGQGVDPSQAIVAEFMSLRVLTAYEDETSEEVARRMLDAEIRHLPVLRGTEVVGTISMRDVLALELWGSPLTS